MVYSKTVIKPLKRPSFLCTGKPGCANCVSVFAPNGRLLFCIG